MYALLGKRWIMLGMKHGYKTAIFVNEIEIEMQKQKLNSAKKRKEGTEHELELLKASPLPSIPESITEAKEKYDYEQKLKKEREEALKGLEKLQHECFQDEQLADGELSRIYSIAYQNRLKYDFLCGYKIKDTYADK
jgi:hypothetical protein